MKRIITALFLLAVIFSVDAQLLWKVTGNGASKPSYLFGTHHVAPIAVLDSVKGFDEALAGVDRVYGEIVMSQMTDPANAMKIAQFTMAPADSTLDKVMTPEQLAAIDRIFAENGLPVTSAQVNILKPIAVTNTIAVVLSQKALPGFDPNQQLDAAIQKRAIAQNKEVAGLETLDDQLEILFGTPISKQAKDLAELLDDPQKTVTQTYEMANAYMAHDIAKLGNLITDDDSGMTDEEAAKLLYDRNNAWLEVLIGAIPTASVMAVVGAGHLPGENGLINLLRKAGYSVEPVD